MEMRKIKKLATLFFILRQSERNLYVEHFLKEKVAPLFLQPANGLPGVCKFFRTSMRCRSLIANSSTVARPIAVRNTFPRLRAVEKHE